MSTKVYRYGLLAPTENADVVADQIRHAHSYYNKLVELERRRRDQIRGIIDTETGDVLGAAKQADAERQSARKALARENAEKRSRKKADPKLQKALKDASKKRKKALATLKKARSKAFKEHKETIRSINQRHGNRLREARKNTPTYWGTYTIVEDALKASANDKMLWDRRDWFSPSDPEFKRWRGEGRLSVQVQKSPQDKKPGLASEAVFQENNLVWVDPVDERAWCDPVRGVRRRFSRTKLHFRIDSDENRKPVWTEFPMIMHRPLPEGGRVKRVTIHKKRIGTRVEWSAHFTVNTDAVIPESRPVSGMVAIDVGWRKLDSGAIRVAAWDASDGKSGYLEVSPELISALQYNRQLRSIRNNNFNEIISQLVEHFKHAHVPSWLCEELGRKEKLTPEKARAVLAQLRSMDRLAYLTRRWAEEGVTEKHAYMYQRLEEWRYHDFHLYSWESDQAKKSQRRRKDLYRNFAAELSRTYETLVLEDFKLDRLVRRNDVGAESENETARANRHMVALYELRDSLINAFNRCGAVVIVDPRDSTRTCHVCGVVNDWDQAAELEHRCVACGTIWDQDDNAALILRRRGAGFGGGDGAGTARGSKSGNDYTRKAPRKRPSRSYQELHRRRRESAARSW